MTGVKNFTYTVLIRLQLGTQTKIYPSDYDTEDGDEIVSH